MKYKSEAQMSKVEEDSPRGRGVGTRVQLGLALRLEAPGRGMQHAGDLHAGGQLQVL